MCVNPMSENILEFNSIKILFIDDDKKSNDTITSFFLENKQNYEISHNSISALNKFYSTSFDLIIADASIQNSDGISIIQKIRDANKLVPIIVMSGALENEELISLMKLDVSGFVSKPLQKEELFLSIKKAIEKITIRNTIENQKKELVEINNDLENQMIQRISEIYSLNQEIRKTQTEVIFTMGTVCESRSKETGNHIKRVASYSEIFAKYYGLNEEDVLLLKEASPMHDIGKIAIPDSILHKAGRLDEEERTIMNSHAIRGYDMLKNSKRKLLQIAATVAHEHHEKYDGSGYPRKLKAEEISIYGRITALADVFDALGSDRCYKKAWEDKKIFAMIQNEKGKHFDPKLVDIFFEHIDEFFAVRSQYMDVIIEK